MVLSLPKDLVSVIKPQLEAWTAELEHLRGNSRVKKFLKLQERIDRAGEFITETSAPPPSNRYRPFDPYDAYDVFEFARDLAGREISTIALSKLASGRFPDMSGGCQERMMDYLIENGCVEATRRTRLGRPASYRFAPPKNGGAMAGRKPLGVPTNELSGFKAEDLEQPV
ncbi:MAG TPA: hypothetical protein VEO96_06155 [Thermoplasmata archaeon]|nr:hypothetical protein [Thermoplasmata archaeon]